jgi:hypothetical protein
MWFEAINTVVPGSALLSLNIKVGTPEEEEFPYPPLTKERLLCDL